MNFYKSEILPSIQERFTPDFLMNNSTWRDRKIFFIVIKLLEQIGIHVSRPKGVPMPNKTFYNIFPVNSEIINQFQEINKLIQYHHQQAATSSSTARNVIAVQHAAHNSDSDKT